MFPLPMSDMQKKTPQSIIQKLGSEPESTRVKSKLWKNNLQEKDFLLGFSGLKKIFSSSSNI
jgi:hypothetical protein